MKNKLLTLFFAAVMFGAAGTQQSVAEAQAKNNEASTPVIVYGQELHPELFTFRGSDYRWEDLSHLLPQLLQNQEDYNLTADETCEHLHDLNMQYINEIEKLTNPLIYQMEFAVVSGQVDAPADMALTTRLASKSPEDMQLLYELIPDKQKELRIAKDFTLKSLAMILLQDAAIENCPEFAKANSYFQFTIGPGGE